MLNQFYSFYFVFFTLHRQNAVVDRNWFRSRVWLCCCCCWYFSLFSPFIFLHLCIESYISNNESYWNRRNRMEFHWKKKRSWFCNWKWLIIFELCGTPAVSVRLYSAFLFGWISRGERVHTINTFGLNQVQKRWQITHMVKRGSERQRNQMRREKKRNVEYQEMKKFNQFASLHLFITSTPMNWSATHLCAFFSVCHRNIWNYLNFFKEIYVILYHRSPCISCIRWFSPHSHIEIGYVMFEKSVEVLFVFFCSISNKFFSKYLQFAN